jgi:hypothetical protein
MMNKKSPISISKKVDGIKEKVGQRSLAQRRFWKIDPMRGVSPG